MAWKGSSCRRLRRSRQYFDYQGARQGHGLPCARWPSESSMSSLLGAVANQVIEANMDQPVASNPSPRDSQRARARRATGSRSERRRSRSIRGPVKDAPTSKNAARLPLGIFLLRKRGRKCFSRTTDYDGDGRASLPWCRLAALPLFAFPLRLFTPLLRLPVLPSAI